MDKYIKDEEQSDIQIPLNLIAEGGNADAEVNLPDFEYISKI